MKCIALALLLLRSFSPSSEVVPQKPNPKVRAITILDNCRLAAADLQSLAFA